MTVRNLTMVWMLAVASFAAGCGRDCPGLCEERNGCKEAAVKLNCDKTCDEGVNDLAACETQLDFYLQCLDKRDDICQTGITQCAGKLADYIDCRDGYCINHPKDCAAGDAFAAP